MQLSNLLTIFTIASAASAATGTAPYLHLP